MATFFQRIADQLTHTLLGRKPLDPSTETETPVDENDLSRFPYRNNLIYEDINDLAEEHWVNTILRMNYDELKGIMDEAQLRNKLDSTFTGNNREYVLICKAGIARAEQLRAMGQLCSPLTLGDHIKGHIKGWGIATAAVGATTGLTGSFIGDYYAAAALEEAMYDQLNKQKAK